jgi:hypothetical protein
MPLQQSGSISISDIRNETQMSQKNNYSLDNGENGQTNQGYPRINLCSPLRPSDNDGCSLSEWRGYDHNITCNVYRYLAVYYDGYVGLCNVSPPINTPADDTPATSCYEIANVRKICCGSDPQIPQRFDMVDDGYSTHLNFANWTGDVVISNVVIVNRLGQTLASLGGTYVNGSYDLRNLNLSGPYYIIYDVGCCGETTTVSSDNFVVIYPVTGNVVRSYARYHPTDAAASCLNTTQYRKIFYDYNTANTGANIPIALNSTLYSDTQKTITALAGYYTLPNNKRYTVSSAGVVTNIQTSACATAPTFTTELKLSSFIVSTTFTQNHLPYSPNVGDCHRFINTCNSKSVRGVVSSYQNGKVTLINYTCN